VNCLLLELDDILHRYTKVGNPRTHCLVKRFNHTVLDKFFRTASHKNLYEFLEALQAELDTCIQQCNDEGRNVVIETWAAVP